MTFTFRIRSFQDRMIKPEQVSEIAHAILEWQASVTESVKAAHISNLRRRHK